MLFTRNRIVYFIQNMMNSRFQEWSCTRLGIEICRGQQGPGSNWKMYRFPSRTSVVVALVSIRLIYWDYNWPIVPIDGFSGRGIRLAYTRPTKSDVSMPRRTMIRFCAKHFNKETEFERIPYSFPLMKKTENRFPPSASWSDVRPCAVCDTLCALCAHHRASSAIHTKV